jgi:hypothetical protein
VQILRGMIYKSALCLGPKDFSSHLSLPPFLPYNDSHHFLGVSVPPFEPFSDFLKT